MLYRFGPYELDSTRLELLKFGIRVRLERKPLQLLIALLEHSGAVVTRDQLHRLLWADSVFVDFDRGLTVAMAKLRTALNDSSEYPIYVKTIAGEGYRFIGKVEPVLDTAPPISRTELARTDPTLETSSSESEPPVHIANGTQPQTFRKRSRFIAAAALISAAVLSIVLVLTGSTFLRRIEQPQPVRSAKTMLVVLPFENLSGDPTQEYLADGITEELSARLGNLDPKHLGVIGRTSAMAYKGSKHTINEIGKELSVGYVLEGSVRREGAKLRITAQLVNVSDQAHVWAEDYDRHIGDLVQLEDEVASDIARQVGTSLAVAPRTNPLHRHLPTPEAHEAYLVGRYYWYKRTAEGWRKSREYFRRAIENDPEYAAAYAGLAEALPPRQEALAAAKKAVELDPTSGEAYTALGWVEYFQEWDFVAADTALKTAIHLDPNYAPPHHIYCRVLDLSGHSQEAIEQEKQAVLLDPLALIFRAALAGGLASAGQDQEGLEQINQIFAIDPHYPKAHESLGVIYLRRGMYKEAIHEFEVSERYGLRERAPLGYAYARLGNKQQALRILSELHDVQRRSPSGDVSGDIAVVEMGLGNADAALAWLEKEYEQHDEDGPWFAKVDPMFTPLRSDPRFQQLMRRVKFPS